MTGKVLPRKLIYKHLLLLIGAVVEYLPTFNSGWACGPRNSASIPDLNFHAMVMKEVKQLQFSASLKYGEYNVLGLFCIFIL